MRGEVTSAGAIARSVVPARRSRRSARGFTLIELGVSLALIVLMIAAVIPSLESVAGVRGREAAGEMSALVRYIYDQAALSGKACRIVFDMDAGAYWAECTSDRFVLDSEKVRSRDGRAVIEDKLKKEKQRQSASIDPKDEVAAQRERVEKEAEFAAFTGFDVPKKFLPDNVLLQVWTGHQVDRLSKGQAYLYFFPQGFTERAQIYVSSAGDTYTLVVSPLTGKVKVVDEDLELPKDAT
jgi:general secretion pathway protein H